MKIHNSDEPEIVTNCIMYEIACPYCKEAISIGTTLDKENVDGINRKMLDKSIFDAIKQHHCEKT